MPLAIANCIAHEFLSTSADLRRKRLTLVSKISGPDASITAPVNDKGRHPLSCMIELAI